MLSQDRDTKTRAGLHFGAGIKASTVIYAGALSAITAAGLLVPASADTTLIVVGRALTRFDNSNGVDGAINGTVDFGIFRWDNSADADEITVAHIGQVCYAVDDHTVALTSNSKTRPVAGRISDVDDGGVWVATGFGNWSAPDGALSNVLNLSDVVNAASARANIGANKIYVPLHIADLVGGDAKVYGVPAPCTGHITKVLSVLEGHALATGDATLTGKIAAAAITNGVVTITEVASAVGDKDSATPSAANAVAEGDWVNFTVGGTNDNAVAFADLLIEITY